MGNLKYRFLKNGVDLSIPPYNFAETGKAQYLRGKYWISKIEEIEVNGDDFVVDFDIDHLDETIEWDQIAYPNDETKAKVIEVLYYKEIRDNLNDILRKINGVTFSESYYLARYGREAIDIIQSTAVSKSFPSLILDKDEPVAALLHTIGKEVEIAESIRNSSSQRSKDSALNSAKRHLTNDITFFKVHLDVLDVNAHHN